MYIYSAFANESADVYKSACILFCYFAIIHSTSVTFEIYKYTGDTPVLESVLLTSGLASEGDNYFSAHEFLFFFSRKNKENTANILYSMFVRRLYEPFKIAKRDSIYLCCTEFGFLYFLLKLF